MTDLWLRGFEQIEVARRPGGRFDPGDRWKLCLHTTEGSSIEGAVAAYRKRGVPPHVTVDPWKKKRAQHVPLNRRSYSLRSSEAEDEPVIQVEIVGYAAETHNWPDEVVDWLAVEVAAPIRAHCPFALAAPSVGFGGTEGYGTAGKYRLTMSEWERFSGVVGHSHSPPPDTHWDPGRFRIGRFLDTLRTTSPPPPSPPSTGAPFMLRDFVEDAYYQTRGYSPFTTGRDIGGALHWVRTAAAAQPDKAWTWTDCLDSPDLGVMVALLLSEG